MKLEMQYEYIQTVQSDCAQFAVNIFHSHRLGGE